MGAVVTTRMLAIAAASVIGVAIVDSAVGRDWDLMVVASLALMLQLLTLVGLGRRRHQVPLRADLARWLEDRASLTGESVETIVDRAIAGYSAGLGARPTEEHLPRGT